MVMDHSDSERGNPLPPHGLLFSINSKGSFICTIHIQDNTCHGLCYTSRGALAGTRNSSIGPPVQRPFEGRKDIFYLTTDSTHFIYGYMASDIW